MNYPHFKRYLGVVLTIVITLSLVPFQLYAPPAPQMPAMSQEEIDAIARELDNYIKNLSPQEREELEQLGRSMMKEMGYDPDTGLPVGQSPESVASVAETPQSIPTEEAPVVPAEKPTPKVSSDTISEIHSLLESIIDGISVLRKKASLGAEKKLMRWQDDLNNLMYHLKVLNQPQHHEHLAQQEFAPLISSLRTFEKTLRSSIPHLIIPDQQQYFEDPYDMLGIHPQASMQEIDDAYAALAQRHSPEKVRERLSNQGIVGAGLEKAVQEAELGFSFIKEAYEKLHDTASRDLIDAERKARQTTHQKASETMHAALDKITHALSNAIFQDQLMKLLDDYMKKYEPRAAELKKQMEKEEAARLKEHKDFSQIKAPRPVGAISRRGSGAFYPPADRYHPDYYPRGNGGYTPSLNEPIPMGGKQIPDMPKGGGRGGSKNDGKTSSSEQEKKDEKAAVLPTGKGSLPKKTEEASREQSKEEVLNDAISQRIQQLDAQLHRFNADAETMLTKSPKEREEGAQDLLESLAHIKKIATDLHTRIKETKKENRSKYAPLWQAVKKNVQLFEQKTHTLLTIPEIALEIETIKKQCAAIGELLPMNARQATADPYALMAQSIDDLSESLFALKQAIDESLITQLQQEPSDANIAQIDASPFAQALSRIDEIIDYTYDKVRNADDRKKRQYATLWKNIEQRVRDAKSLLNGIKPMLPEQSVTKKQTDTVLTHIGEIEKHINAHNSQKSPTGRRF